MCLGAVFVLGGVGMAVSQVSSAYPNLCKLITGWVKTSLPEDFPFSSLQINYNYAARKHVDGNNIGPSYIRSLGKHTGGELWTADAFVEATDEDTGEKYVKGGGGQQVLIPASRTTRGHRTRSWVVSFSSLSRFGPCRCSAQASVPVDLIGGPLLPERDVESEAARDVRGIGEVQQGPRGLSRTKALQIPALLLLLQQQVAADPVAGLGSDHHERPLRDGL